MSIVLLLILSAVGILGFAAAAILLTTENTVARGLAVLISLVFALGIAAFCTFGFLATFEMQERTQRLHWQVGYAGVGLMTVAGGGKLLMRATRRSR